MNALLAINIGVTIAALIEVKRSHNHLIEHLDRRTNKLQREVIMAQQDAVNAIVATLRKSKEEIVGKIADLQAQIDAGVPAEQLDLSDLAAAAQALDDVVPDAPEVTDDAPTEVEGEPVEDPENPPF